jgi:NAD(P)-dependent dehydrogenase (short-subunit alcohol dehydrogenase family)
MKLDNSTVLITGANRGTVARAVSRVINNAGVAPFGMCLQARN